MGIRVLQTGASPWLDQGEGKKELRKKELYWINNWIRGLQLGLMTERWRGLEVWQIFGDVKNKRNGGSHEVDEMYLFMYLFIYLFVYLIIYLFIYYFF